MHVQWKLQIMLAYSPSSNKLKGGQPFLEERFLKKFKDSRIQLLSPLERNNHLSNIEPTRSLLALQSKARVAAS